MLSFLSSVLSDPYILLLGAGCVAALRYLWALGADIDSLGRRLEEVSRA